MTTSFKSDSPAVECVTHFKQLMSITTTVQGWVKLTRSLLDDYTLTPDELKLFMTWAATENTDPKPQFNSVEYLAKANDPMTSLVKNAPTLIKSWKARRKSDLAIAKAKAPVVASSTLSTYRDRWYKGSINWKDCEKKVATLFARGLCKHDNFETYYNNSSLELGDAAWDEWELFTPEPEQLKLLQKFEN
jgi:hypothetical protein